MVAALERHGLGRLLREAAGSGHGSAVVDALRTAATGAAAGNVVNNLPAYLALEPAAAGSGTGSGLRLIALVVGVNAGPLITVWAALATLLWRARCQARGVRIGAVRFAAEGLLLAVPLLTPTAVTVALTSGAGSG